MEAYRSRPRRGLALRPARAAVGMVGHRHTAAAMLDEAHETRWFDKTLGTHIARVVTLN